MEKLVVLSSSEIIEGWELDLLWEIEFNQTPNYSPIDKVQSLKQARNKFECEFIANILRKNNGNISKTAQQLQINRSHLHEKILQLKIKV